MLPSAQDLTQLAEGRHPDPFAVLGPHPDALGETWVTTMAPGARWVEAETDRGSQALFQHGTSGIFRGSIRDDAPYRLRVTWGDGTVSLLDDPYSFGVLIGDTDLWHLAEGSHRRPHEVLGAHRREFDGVAGVAFAVWAPNASRVSVVGDFNQWDGRRHPMRLRRECGVWELFVPGLEVGARYKFELLDSAGRLLPQKADPCARQAELRPETASIVAPEMPRLPESPTRRGANAHDAPISIYEVHLPSWRRKPEQGNRWLDWDELADTLVPYASELGFTHLELLPVSEHPFDGSWGYQTFSLYAPTARLGDPAGLRRFIERAHAEGIGVLLDWVPAHFPTDAHGLAEFDGTHLYEYADRREGFHNDWNTLIYNYSRTEVRQHLAGSALYWLECFGADGLRVDAVASMIYRDYSRKSGEWVPNVQGGRENLEAISLLKHINEVIGAERPAAATFAEESTSFPGVSRPTHSGGLGFWFKWNMGWMHDTLQYMARDPVHRPWHHGEMTFGLIYAFSEHFVLPLSHDEVVHGKGSLLAKMPGDRWQRFANLRAYFGFLWGHPGKKLLFMGGEFAQEREWNHEQSLDWHLLSQPEHAGMQRLVGDLNRLLRAAPALHQRDASADGFEWVDHQDARRSLLAFVRHGEPGTAPVLVVCNFAPVVRDGLRLGVPRVGSWVERINTDAAVYGGSNVGLPLGAATSEAVPRHGKPQSVVLRVPPLATLFLQWTAPT
jgi:1,4-alpha-glucan branching enzyme